MSDSRYPFTYAYDYLRTEAADGIQCNVSRAECAKIVEVIADTLGPLAMGLNATKICELLADRYLAEEKSGMQQKKLEKRLQISGLLSDGGGT